ncbi:hypothetical protein VOLCADRAFT_62543 [Volvox carteri f. nagariensis]|uniref:Proteasome subunit beta n=1 Tax=Volvox carteri f. nagariensis TaxID=3068 RepID=D8U1R0_VOLCA|nr:uncharacterized protein VOLCADRAFT_62543 [Volvox carteri f. nagariensis]EFJ46384.1 hypothetical protein VOLCADRAFT_62543 [Volvox carteri f. nagariensis]|eukprot:XP_002952537.1 hypothetical protein VOLCADRAFT_62543 [Volvox carteri f. nagariensis]
MSLGLTRGFRQRRTVVAVAGEDYCIVAGSTRMSTGFSILTRDASMLLQLTDKVVVASAGMQADRKALHKLLQHRNVTYQHNHGRAMGVSAAAQLLSNTLYYNRFFPLYTFNLVAGLDEQGRGAVYNYDAIGSYERSGYFCQGSGKELIQPVLEGILRRPDVHVPFRTCMALDLVKDAFVSAGERDIYTGDKVEILIITKDGIKREELQLKLD